MHSRFEVRNRDGQLLGIFPAPISDHADSVRALVADHPGAEVHSTVSLDDPCAEHPAYEADYCPICGSARSLTGSEGDDA